MFSFCSFPLPFRFCTDCKNKVLRAYNILVGELDCTKEKGYCAALYEGIRCCPNERHVHVCCETDFIAHLLGRAEPEFTGGYEYVNCYFFLCSINM